MLRRLGDEFPPIARTFDARPAGVVQVFYDAACPAHAWHREFRMVAVLGGDVGRAAADTTVGADGGADRLLGDAVGRLATGGQRAGEQRLRSGGGQYGG